MTNANQLLLIIFFVAIVMVQIIGMFTKWQPKLLAKSFAVTVVVKSIILVLLLIEHTRLSILSIVLLFLIPGIIGYGVELLGVKTSVPFGPYHYTKLWSPRLFGVPLLLIPGWFCFVLMSFVVASSVTAIPLLIALLTAQLTSAIDLIIDPLCVEIGIWKWHKQGRYFGIPIQNFIGWFATSLAIVPLLFPFAIHFSPSIFPPILTLFGMEMLLQCFAYAFLWPWKNWKIAFFGLIIQGWPFTLLLF